MSRAGGGVWLLALGQTLTYAGVYYAFPALLPDLIAQTGWSVADLAFGPTLGFLVMAALIPVTGRLLDSGYGPLMMVAGPILGAASLVGLGLTPSLGLWNALWFAIGLAQAGSLYETCFALLTRALGQDGAPMTPRAAITRITLVAGFAGSLAFPLGHYLGAGLGGQGALMVFAALVALAAPINAAGLALLTARSGDGGGEGDGGGGGPSGHQTAPRGTLTRALRRPAFWGIALIFSAIWLNHGILLTYVLMLLQDRGASAGLAAFAAAMIGPSQVVARLVLMLGDARISSARATLWALSFVVAAGIVLTVAKGVPAFAPAMIILFAALQGAGAGLLSILRPVLVAELLGRAGFGALSGAVSVGPILATAAAPALGAHLLRLGGAALIYQVCLTLAALGFALGLWLLRRPQGERETR